MSNTLTNDPDSWNEPLVSDTSYYNTVDVWHAGLEVSGTVSTILGDGRHVTARHNRDSRWAVRIDDTTKREVDMHWSCYTPDGNSVRYIRRGEALMCICHETFHVKFTDEVIRPAYCPKHHWASFFECVNFAEDVRIENLGEYDVPMFGILRSRENDRLLLENIHAWENMTVTRRACVAMFAQHSCSQSVLAQVAAALTSDHEVQSIVTQAESAFSVAVRSKDTNSLVLALEPVYDVLSAYYPPEPPPGGDGGEGGEEEGEEKGEEEGEDTGQGGSGGDSGTDIDPDAPIRPDSERGKWGTPRAKSDTDSVGRTVSDEALDGDALFRKHNTKPDQSQPSRVESKVGQFRKHLRRVLQENAVGSWAGKHRRGKFSVRNARGLSLGDLRLFRQHTGASGGLDYSLVLCLDSSGSVAHMPGQVISDTGLAVLEAAKSINGLDVALCAYGSDVMGGVPFGFDTSRSGNSRRLYSMLAGITRGYGGGTAEEAAIMWAYSASKRRAAEQPLILILTDGYPHDQEAAKSAADVCRSAGMLTGAITIGFDDSPAYHDYHAVASHSGDIPRVTSDLIRRMMKEN